MFISCPEISIFLVKTTCETASDKLVPSLQFVPDSSTVPRYILVRENMPVRGLGVDIYNAGDESEFVLKLAQVSSIYRLRSVLICQKSPPSGHLEKSVSPNPDPWDHLIDQIPTLCPTPPPSGLTLIGALPFPRGRGQFCSFTILLTQNPRPSPIGGGWDLH